MNVNGEQVWVPRTRRELIAGLRRMGVTRIGAQTLGRVAKQELVREYCRKRAEEVRTRQAGHRRTRTVYQQSFVAWTAKD